MQSQDPDPRPSVTIRRSANGLVADIGGSEIGIVDYAVATDGLDHPSLTLVLMPSALAIDGASPEVPEQSPAEIAPAISSWGGGMHPDPRENIPGWVPEQVGHAESRAFAEAPLRNHLRDGNEVSNIARVEARKAGLNRLQRLGMGGLIGPLGLSAVGA